MSTIAQEKPADAILAIDAVAKKYSEAREHVGAAVQSFESAVAELRRHHLPHIKKLLAKAADRQSELVGMIQARPDLFVQPRTMTLHGIKLGMQKGKGKIVWDDAEKVVERIKAQLPKAQAEALLDVKIVASKEALLSLDVQQLKKLGCRVEGTGDFVYIRAADSEVDKLLEKILKEGEVAEGDAS